MRLILATAIAAAVIAPLHVYAASTSTVSIGNTNGTATATVVPGTHQLETTLTAPNNVVMAVAVVSPGSCTALYLPPSGKALMVTQITYDLGSGTQGTESWAALSGTNCSSYADYGDTVQAYEAQSHTFPTGLPMQQVSVHNGTFSAYISVSISGYLIPATLVPPEAPQHRGPMKADARQ